MPLEYIEGSDVPHVPANEYAATIFDIDNTVTRFGAGYKVTYELDDHDGFKVSQIFSTATTPGSKLGQLVKAMTGRALPPGERLPVNELIGRRVVLKLSVQESGFNRVDAAWPAPPQKGGNGSPAQPQPRPTPPASTPRKMSADEYELFQLWKQEQAEAEARIPAPADESSVTEAPHPAEGGAA